MGFFKNIKKKTKDLFDEDKRQEKELKRLKFQAEKAKVQSKIVRQQLKYTKQIEKTQKLKDQLNKSKPKSGMAQFGSALAKGIVAADNSINVVGNQTAGGNQKGKKKKSKNVSFDPFSGWD